MVTDFFRCSHLGRVYHFSSNCTSVGVMCLGDGTDTFFLGLSLLSRGSFPDDETRFGCLSTGNDRRRSPLFDGRDHLVSEPHQFPLLVLYMRSE